MGCRSPFLAQGPSASSADHPRIVITSKVKQQVAKRSGFWQWNAQCTLLAAVVILIVGNLLFENLKGDKSSNSASVSSYRSGSYSGHTTRTKSRSEWYSSGDLHAKKIREWRNASYANRLATSADFAARMLDKNGERPRSMDDLRPIASSLEIAISEVARGGDADSQSVASVASACWVLLNR